MSTSNSKQADSVRAVLAGLPDTVTIEALAALMGWKNQTIYCKRVAWKRDPSILPESLPQPPGSRKVLFAKMAIFNWMMGVEGQQDAAPTPEKKPYGGKPRGRPLGSKSRRGIGRAELEARS